MSSKEVRLIDANALLEQTELICGRYEVKWTDNRVMVWIDNAPTIDPESLKSNKNTIPLDEVYRVIAGHSDYHGDNILAALTCIAEGRDVKPVKPLDDLRPHGKWILEREPDGKPYCFHCSVCDPDFHYIGITVAYDYCPNCGAEMEVDNV